MDKGKGSAGSTEETLHELMQVSTRYVYSRYLPFNIVPIRYKWETLFRMKWRCIDGERKIAKSARVYTHHFLLFTVDEREVRRS